MQMRGQKDGPLPVSDARNDPSLTKALKPCDKAIKIDQDMQMREQQGWAFYVR